ncbi:hypothetical protein EV182_001863 [Spiromyces aspiralis]|uniref:Uncharacterized protein n=1 Tax=Spiromyces aspiralis TaxID=68401 RepID=A0ACC1HHM0_9FUNG|nr:hypothetical protein EV182_001863 [Spiromyces aspiralis]
MATKDPTTPTSRYQPYPASSTRKRKNPKSDFVATLYTVFKLEGKEDKFGWHDDVTIYINDPRALIREINSHGFSLGKEYSLYRSLNVSVHTAFLQSSVCLAYQECSPANSDSTVSMRQDYSFRRHAKYDRRKPHNRQGASDDGSQGLIYTHTQGYFNRKCPELLSHIKRKSALSNRRYKGRAGSTNARNQQQQHQESLVSSEPNSCETSELSLSSPLLETIIANLCYTGTPANVQPGFIPLSAQSANDQLLPLSTGQLRVLHARVGRLNQPATRAIIMFSVVWTFPADATGRGGVNRSYQPAITYR